MVKGEEYEGSLYNQGMGKKVTLADKLIDDPKEDVLINGLTHKVMLFFNIPTGWSTWQIGFFYLMMASLIGGMWGIALAEVGVAVGLAAIWLLFVLVDVALLQQLPRRLISFGAWQAQSFGLMVPRWLVAVLLVLPAIWWGSLWGMGLFVVAQLAGTLLLYYGAVVEPHRLGVTQVVVKTDRLPSDVEPIRVLHISDLHIERWTKRETAVLALTKQMQPDIIVITGDYVNLSYNRDPKTQQLVIDLLRQLSAPHGVYAVLGSPPVDLHETVLPIFDEVDISLLRWGWHEVALGNGRFLTIMGMDCTHHLPTDRARLDQLHQQAPNHHPQLFMYHSPELMPEVAERQIDLYLCGHTHGGQVRLPFVGPILTSSQLGRRYVMGLYKEGRTHLYVSRGVGLEGLSAPRVRFLAAPEMTLITIQGTKEAT